MLRSSPNQTQGLPRYAVNSNTVTVQLCSTFFNRDNYTLYLWFKGSVIILGCGAIESSLDPFMCAIFSLMSASLLIEARL